jgi:hypothetical protein
MKAIQNVSAVFYRLPQEEATPLRVGSIETHELTCQNTAQGDLGLCTLAAFGLLI